MSFFAPLALAATLSFLTHPVNGLQGATEVGPLLTDLCEMQAMKVLFTDLWWLPPCDSLESYRPPFPLTKSLGEELQLLERREYQPQIDPGLQRRDVDAQHPFGVLGAAIPVSNSTPPSPLSVPSARST